MLKRTIRYDKLGVNAAILQLEITLDKKRLVAPEQFLPMLDRVIKNESVNGAYVEGTGGFWRRWVVRAVQVLREQGITVKHEGHAAAMQWLSAEEYAQACRDAGLRPTSVELVKVDMSAESLADIGRFSLFIEGALPGVPLQEGSDALQVGLERTMDELKVDSVQRNWLEVVAEAD